MNLLKPRKDEMGYEFVYNFINAMQIHIDHMATNLRRIESPKIFRNLTHLIKNKINFQVEMNIFLIFTKNIQALYDE